MPYLRIDLRFAVACFRHHQKTLEAREPKVEVKMVALSTNQSILNVVSLAGSLYLREDLGLGLFCKTYLGRPFS